MQTNTTTTAKDSAAALRMRLFGIHSSSSGASGNTNSRDVAALQAIHTQTAQALVESTPSQATARPPLRVEAYASALSQGARALSASGHAAAMAAVVGGGAMMVTKIPKKTTTTITNDNKPAATTTAAVAAPPLLFCPIPVKTRVVVVAGQQEDIKKKNKRVSSSDDEEDTIDVEDAQRERAYARAEEQAKRRLAPPAKKAKFTPAPTPARVLLAELDQTNPWVVAANQVLAAAPAAAVVAAPPPPPAKAAAPQQTSKAPTKILVRDKKTNKLTGKIVNTVRREARRTMGPNRDLVLRKVKVDIYQRANPSSATDKRLVHVKAVRWNLREYRKRYDVPAENPAVRARMLDPRDLRQSLQFPLQVQLYGATLNFVASEDFAANPKTRGIFSVNTDAPAYRDDLYRAALAARPGDALADLFLGA